MIGWRKESSHYYPVLSENSKCYKVASLFEDLPALIPDEEKNEYASKTIDEYFQCTGKDGLFYDFGVKIFCIGRMNVSGRLRSLFFS